MSRAAWANLSGCLPSSRLSPSDWVGSHPTTFYHSRSTGTCRGGVEKRSRESRCPTSMINCHMLHQAEAALGTHTRLGPSILGRGRTQASGCSRRLARCSVHPDCVAVSPRKFVFLSVSDTRLGSLTLQLQFLLYRRYSVARERVQRTTVHRTIGYLSSLAR